MSDRLEQNKQAVIRFYDLMPVPERSENGNAMF